MRSGNSKSRFQLEALESRILLSADGLFSAETVAPVEIEACEYEDSTEVLPDQPAWPANRADDFLPNHPGDETEDVLASASVGTISALVDQGISAAQQSDLEGSGNHVYPDRGVLEVAGEVVVETVAIVCRVTAIVPVAVSEFADPLPAQLTETLRSANGPPASSSDAELDTVSSASTSPGSDTSSVGGALDSAGAVQSTANAQDTHLNPDQSLTVPEGLIVRASDRLSGNGRILGDVINQGTFSPGNSPGIITIHGDLTLSAGDPDVINDDYTSSGTDTVGSVLIEIGGPNPGPGSPNSNEGYDQINVTGKVTLGGTLQIQLINGFTPTHGQSFEIMTFESVEGDFSGITAYYIGEGLYLKPVKTANAYRLDVVNWMGLFGSGLVPENLNSVIDFLLSTFDRSSPPTGSDAEFTSSASEIPNLITVGTNLSGGVDLELLGVTLQFSGLLYDGNWTGQVVVEATNATLFPGQLDIEVADDQDDADLFSVGGIIYLAPGNPNSFLKLDDLEAEDIGWPSFIEIEITNLAMEFADFRLDDSQNNLNLSATFLGLDTGNETFNDLLAADNLLFGLSVTGSVENLVLDMDAIQQGARNLVSGKISFPSSPIVDFGGVTGGISGNLLKVGQLSAGFILNKVTYDPDGSANPLPVRDAIYLAVEGTFNLGEAITKRKGGGSRDGGFGIAFAISERGPLQFFIYGGPIRRFEPTTGLTLEALRFGVRFYTTIEGLQTDIDFQATEATDLTYESVEDPDDPERPYLYRVTLTMPGHDLEVGDDFRILDAVNDDYNGDFTVLTINGDQVTYRLKYDPGEFVSSASIIRLTIKNPEDLTDEGLQSGITPPDNILIWRDQLDQQVRHQLEEPSVSDSWASLFENAVFGGGATLSIDPIPDFILLYDVDLLIDTNLRIFLKGEMNLFDGLVKFPTRQFADLSALNQGSGRYLYLQTQPETPIFEPLLVYRGEIAFEALVGSDVLRASVINNTANGFWEIELELALDNPSSEYALGDQAVIFGSNPSTFDWTYQVIGVDDDANTITVQIGCDLDGNGVCSTDEINAANPGLWQGGGKVANENALVGFGIVLEGGVDLNIPGLNADLEAITVTTLTLEGQVTIEFLVPGPAVPEDLRIELSFAAALSETHVGDIASVAGGFVVTVDVGEPLILTDDSIIVYGAALLNTELDFLEKVGLFMDASGFLRINSGDVEQSITLPDNTLVALPANSFALRLDGSVDFRINFDGEDGFAESESVFLIDAIFVLEFSAAQGFNVAVFDESGGTVGPARLKIGPAESPILQFEVFGFLAIRGNGIAANMILGLDGALSGSLADVASMHGQFVFMVNTIGDTITFNIPGSADKRGGSDGLSVEIPRAPPASIAEASLNVFDLVAGKAWSLDPSTPGTPYVLVLLGGTNPVTDPDASFEIGGFSLRGKFSFLVSFHQIQLSVSANLNLTLHGTNIFSFAVMGEMQINSAGVVAAIDVNLASGFCIPGNLGMEFAATYRLEFNTTGEVVPVQGLGDIRPGARIHAKGTITILVLEIVGEYDLSADSERITLAMAAKVTLFGASLEVNGFAGIYYDEHPGFAFSIQLRLAGSDGVTVRPFPGFSISGAFQLMINTSGAERFDPLNSSISIAARSFKIGVTSLSVNLFGFVLSGSLSIGISPGGLSLDIPSTDPLTLDFFGIITLRVSGYLHTNGQFFFRAEASLKLLDPDIFGFEGNIWVEFCNDGFAGGLNGTFGAFGIKLQAGGEFYVTSGLVKISVHLKLVLIPSFTIKIWTPWRTYWIRVPELAISGNWTMTFGAIGENIELPPPPPPPAPVLARAAANTLYLNIGADVSYRGDIYPSVDENYQITLVGPGTVTGQKLKVSAMGHESVYDNITQIVVADTQGRNDYIAIANDVTVPVSINVGKTVTGQNRFVTGGGPATIQGGSNSDKVEFGPGGGTYIGGPGTSTLTDNSGGLLTVTAPEYSHYLLTDESLTYGNGLTDENGDEIVYVMTFEGVKRVILNGAQNATYETSSLPDPSDPESPVYPWSGNATFNGSGIASIVQANTAANLTLTDNSLTESPGVTITLNNIAIANLHGGEGDNTFNLSGWTKSGSITGGGGIDKLVATNDADFSLTDTSLIRSSGGQVTLAGVELADLAGGTSPNRFSVGDWSGAANLDGMGGADTYSVNLVGSGSGITTISDSIGSPDSVTINGPAVASAVTVRAWQVQCASEVVAYSGVEALTVNGNIAPEVFRIVGLSVPTTIMGGPDQDTLEGPAIHNTWRLTGNNAGDLNGVLTFSSIENLLGGSGDDTFAFDDGAAVEGTIDGDGGINHLDYAAYSTPVEVDLQTGEATGTAGVQNFGDVRGGSADDILGGDDSNNALEGRAGNDILVGRGGADTIQGGLGDDVVVGDQGSSILGVLPTPGSDSIFADILDGGEGSDLVFGDSVMLDWSISLGERADPRFRVLVGALIYDADGKPLVTGVCQRNPGGTPAWSGFRITLLHDSTTNEADDYLAGGPGDDLLFGQTGDDVIQGDGSTDISLTGDARVGAYRDSNNQLQVNPSFGAVTDGDDYIEGGPGKDVIFGDLGQDDLIGGSSSLFGLDQVEQRSDGSDLIFGGSGTGLDRNNAGDNSAQGHANDSDMILGDNGNIYRLLSGGAFLVFNYDNYGTSQIIPRAAELLDYTPGGTDYKPAGAAMDIGAADEIHGESGDDFIYGMTGNDVLFGEGQDDDLIGGNGNDWISGGTGQDGVLGDDGRIYTSRNGFTEPLYGLMQAPIQTSISTPGKIQQATINLAGQLKKMVDLTPFNLDPNGGSGWVQDPLFDPASADDIIFGGWGSDFLHGGAGDDAISGAEALAIHYARPLNPGDILRWGQFRAGEFGFYDEYNPMRRVRVDADYQFVEPGTAGSEFILNFSATDGETVGNGFFTDGDDAIFGDSGNDAIYGGTGEDNLYGGYGDDLLNADDDLDTHGHLNDQPDTQVTYEDRAYGGAGRDVLIANTGGDRLIDWAGNFNCYLEPSGMLGPFTVSRTLQPHVQEFLYALSRSDGADQTLGIDPLRNGEPEGELGMVLEKDPDWKEQTGAPDDPLPGKIPGGRREVLQSANFNTGSMEHFAPDSGTWNIQGGSLSVAPESLGGDAVSVFHVSDLLPAYFEIQASIQAVKPTAGWKSNAYVIFDYQSPTDFKFAGVDIGLNKIVMGHRNAQGWVVDVQSNVQVKPGRYYNMLVAINGTSVTVVVDGATAFSYAFAPRVVEGWSYGLNAGMIGVGSDNSRGFYDNIKVQKLPPQVTFQRRDDFGDGIAGLFTGLANEDWTVTGGQYTGAPTAGTDSAASLVDLDLGHGLETNSFLEIQAKVTTANFSGVLFDQYGPEDFKFVALDAEQDQIVIGHHTTRGWFFDVVLSKSLEAGVSYNLTLNVKGPTVSVSVDNQIVASKVFNAVVVDGSFGVFTARGPGTFDDVTIKTDDDAFRAPEAAISLTAALPPITEPQLVS